MEAQGDGECLAAGASPQSRLLHYRERIVGAERRDRDRAECALEAETSLGRPLILTGRGDVVPQASRRPPAPGSAADAGARAAPGIDAPVAGPASTPTNGALGVPPDIGRVGWWHDGTAPGATAAGAILIAGHVDSARAGRARSSASVRRMPATACR